MTIQTIDIRIPVPAVAGGFGDDLATYSTQIPATQFETVLGHNPQSKNWQRLDPGLREIYETIQRRDNKARRESVSKYLADRIGIPGMPLAGFPAVSIGLTHKPSFDPLPGQDGGIGIMRLSNKGYRVLLDGLGRYSGMKELFETGEEGEKLVEKIVFPVTFFAPANENQELSVADLGQLFADFNFRVFPVPARVAIALDQSDLYIALTNELSKKPFIREHGGMEMRSASRGKKSSALVVQQVLLRMVRGATEGRRFQESDSATAPGDPTLNKETFQREAASISEFFGEIARRMGPKWTTADSVHLSSAGWQALGILHHDMNHRGLTLTPLEKHHVYEAVSNLDWSRENPVWVDTVKIGQWVINKEGQKVVSIRGAGRTTGQELIDYLRKLSGLDSKLKVLQKPEPAMMATV